MVGFLNFFLNWGRIALQRCVDGQFWEWRCRGGDPGPSPLRLVFLLPTSSPDLAVWPCFPPGWWTPSGCTNSWTFLCRSYQEGPPERCVCPSGFLCGWRAVAGTACVSALQLCFVLSLLGDPPVLLLDEPSTGLDPAEQKQLWWAAPAGPGGGAFRERSVFKLTLEKQIHWPPTWAETTHSTRETSV